MTKKGTCRCVSTKCGAQCATARMASHWMKPEWPVINLATTLQVSFIITVS